MVLKELHMTGFKSFVKHTTLEFSHPITAIVGPNGSGKSNAAEAFRFVLGEQSFKSMRGRKGEDLIWGGSDAVPRAGRASVKIVLNNSDRLLDIDYDEVTIERIVHRDGVNQYLINGSQVRLRDVMELLAGANIGATGHHIISQGEADRILSAAPLERRAVLEDALGLKIYQYKKQESEKKLARTRENIQHVESLRKEVQPHLKFLERQVKKLEKAKEIRAELTQELAEYLKRESVYIRFERDAIAAEREDPEREVAKLEEELARAKQTLAESKKDDAESTRLVELERDLSAAREKRDTLSRELGRLEGQIAFAERAQEKARAQTKREGTIAVSDLSGPLDEFKSALEKANKLEDISQIRDLFSRIFENFRDLVEKKAQTDEQDTAADDLDALVVEKKEKERLFAEAAEEEKRLAGEYDEIQKKIEASKDEGREAEREMFRISARQAELRSALNELAGREQRLQLIEEEFKRDIAEAIPLVGRAVEQYHETTITADDGRELAHEEIASEARAKQEARKKEIERKKIRLEELGGGGADEVYKEYEEVKERDAFLGREIEDLEHSAKALTDLITDLEEKLDTKFCTGLREINTEFQRFFELMFGGGKAALVVVKQKRPRRASDDDDEEESEDVQEGIDVQVSLPKKRIKGLEMLSGGERALTSIALIFAMSQVNPPPFLILDETDAALDEANSKRYGDMIQNLAQKSQLILITHNRETMSRAGVLYGVTMGADGVSKLLSVKFEEAVQVAK